MCVEGFGSRVLTKPESIFSPEHASHRIQQSRALDGLIQLPSNVMVIVVVVQALRTFTFNHLSHDPSPL